MSIRLIFPYSHFKPSLGQVLGNLMYSCMEALVWKLRRQRCKSSEVQCHLAASQLMLRSCHKQLGREETLSPGAIISFPLLFPPSSFCQKLPTNDLFAQGKGRKQSAAWAGCWISFVNVVIKSGLKRAGDTLFKRGRNASNWVVKVYGETIIYISGYNKVIYFQ